ncbi:MAG: DUF424 family protein [Candidatus Verstraetearchaeota archaeon]|nr:DUF424 family protein [Candidatus Verstraetearchaeota archaeon]
MAEVKLFVKVWAIREGEVMVAVCDRHLMGKRFSDGKLLLDVNEAFYKGELVSPDAAVDYLKRATVANLVGEVAVQCGKDAGLVHDEGVVTIEGVPHAQFILI